MDDLVCESCGDTAVPAKAIGGFNDAERSKYPRDVIEVFCSKCAVDVHRRRQRLKEILGILGSTAGLEVLGFAEAVLYSGYHTDRPDETYKPNSYEEGSGFGMYYAIPAEALYGLGWEVDVPTIERLLERKLKVEREERKVVGETVNEISASDIEAVCHGKIRDLRGRA